MPFELFLLKLAAVLLVAKACGEAAERLKQPEVLGEVIGGIVLGAGVLGAAAHGAPWVHAVVADSHEPMFACVAQIGAVLLMFECGLESDMDSLLRLGIPALWVACAGVGIQFACGYWLMSELGLRPMGAAFVAASLVSTSVGITVRSFRDLGCSRTKEAQIVLGAAVADDVIGLVVLTVMTGLTAAAVSPATAARTALIAVAFVAASIVLGRALIPSIMML